MIIQCQWCNAVAREGKWESYPHKIDPDNPYYKGNKIDAKSVTRSICDVCKDIITTFKINSGDVRDKLRGHL